MFFAANLKFLRKRKKRSQEDIAQTLELKRSSWSGYENGTATPSFLMLIKIAKYFKISTDTLLTVNLTQLRESQLSDIDRGFDIDITGSRLRVLATTVNQDNEENIELVPVKAKAGYTAGYADPDFIKMLNAFQLPFLSKNKKYRAFEIEGDSMPPVSHGSCVTAEFLQNWNFIKNGHPYIVLTKDDGVVFKVAYNKIQEKGTLLLCSTNPLFEPYEVKIQEVREVWKFVNYINSELPEQNRERNPDTTNSISHLQNEINAIKNQLKQQNLQ